jgi:hypothetical protein
MPDYRAYFVGPEKDFIGYRGLFAKTTAKLSKKPRSFSKAPQLSFGAVLGSSPGLSVKRRSEAASVGGLFHDSLDNEPRGAWSSPPVR